MLLLLPAFALLSLSLLQGFAPGFAVLLELLLILFVWFRCRDALRADAAAPAGCTKTLGDPRPGDKP